jgi:hypothetical protein
MPSSARKTSLSRNPLHKFCLEKFDGNISSNISRSSAGQADESDDSHFQTDEVSFAFNALTHFDFLISEFGPM